MVVSSATFVFMVFVPFRVVLLGLSGSPSGRREANCAGTGGVRESPFQVLLLPVKLEETRPAFGILLATGATP